MQFWRQNDIKYSTDDAKTVVCSEIGRLSHFLGDKIYTTISGDGIVTDRQVGLELEQKLLSSGRTTVGLLSSELDVSREVVDSKIKTLYTPGHKEFYLENDSIITKGELRKLAKTLDANLEHDQVVSCLGFCAENNLNHSALNWLVNNWCTDLRVVNGEIVIKTVKLQEHEKMIIDELNSASEPVPLDVIKDNTDIPGLLGNVILTQKWIRRNYSDRLDGQVDKNGKFVPNAFTAKRQRKCVQQLQVDGVLALDELIKVGIRQQNVQGFLNGYEMSEFHIFDRYIVTDAYVSKMASQVQQDIDNVGFCDLPLVLAAVDYPLYRMKVYTQFVAPQFSRELRIIRHKNGSDEMVVSARYIEKCSKSLADHYQLVAFSELDELEARFTNNVIDFGNLDTELRNLCKDKFINEQSLKNQLQRMRMSPPEGYKFVSLFSQKIITDFQNSLVSGLKSRLMHKQEQDNLKFYIYLQALLDVQKQDEKLSSKLLKDLVEYAQQKPWHLSVDLHNASASPQELASATTAFQQQNKNPHVAEMKQQMLSKLQGQLSKASDPPLILHLSTVIVYSQNCTTGVLHTTGKNVPKVLKLLTNSLSQSADHQTLLNDSIALKEAIVKKESVAETQQPLAEAVKKHFGLPN